MNSQTRNIITIIFISLMISACSNYPKIISATEDKIILKAKPESFMDAFDIAKRECDKNTRIAQYIANGTESLDEVAFKCFDPNADAEVVAEVNVNEATESEITTDVDADIEAISEKALEETPTE